MVYKRRKTKIVKARKQQFNLILNKELWVKGPQQIKEYREEHKTDTCPVSDIVYGEGLDGCVLDHDHNSGLVRGCLNGRTNLFLGRIELYFRKLFGKTDVELLTLLKNLVSYLEDSKNIEPILHGEIIEAEKRRVSKWKNETIHAKLISKGLELLPVTEYTKHDLVTLHLQQFIKEKEDEI